MFCPGFYTDIDECLGYGYGGYSPCQNGCQNTPGSFTCGCPPGYHSVVQGWASLSFIEMCFMLKK